MNTKEIKRKARETIDGNLWNFWKPYLVIIGIELLLSFFTTPLIGDNERLGAIINIICNLFLAPLGMGATYYVLKMVRKEEFSMSDLTCFMKKAWPIIMLSITVSVLTMLWTLLLVIPGIIAAISYIMSSYVFMDGEDDPMECISKSKEMMKGHKMEYFLFVLSFIGWIIIGALTLGIGYIYIIPYYSVSIVTYYDELKKLHEKEEKEIDKN